MNWFNIGLTLDTLGKVLLGITVLMVHWHVLKEHKIDADVLRTMKREQALGASAILLIIIGYVLQLLFH
ncbi:MAG TPA: hypothetical protein ENH86_00975 [Candidatus Jorgensenbacteria bacterium]|nr:hypothetical protein [Candidatus Jorgensenbacteria bacterium]